MSIPVPEYWGQQLKIISFDLDQNICYKLHKNVKFSRLIGFLCNDFFFLIVRGLISLASTRLMLGSISVLGLESNYFV